MAKRIDKSFFTRDVLEVAPELIGKYIVRVLPDGNIIRARITETEAYRGEEDLACHASKGRTPRTETMYNEGGVLYIYLIYGIHWMLNIVTSELNKAQAVLIRGIDNFDGPGKLSKELLINKSLNNEDLENSNQIWIEDNNTKYKVLTKTRIGIDYAGDFWKNKKWRFILDEG